MIYKNIIHNDGIINNFSKIIQSKKISHAFLFHGYKSIGKIGHAIEFSSALLCKEKSNNQIACGHCSSCNKVKNNKHESINYIYPTPSKSNSSSKSIDQLKEELNKTIHNPYYDCFNNSHYILIDSIRKLKKNMVLSSINDNYQINIILEADRLCFPKQESANTLLKILEEPNEKYIFILVTSEYSKIIDTIKSRCNQIFFTKPNIEKINTYLNINHNINKKDSEQISKLCNGNLNIANSLSLNFNSILEEITLVLEYIYNNNHNELIKYFHKFIKNNNRIVLLNLMTIFFIDIISIINHNKVKFSELSELMKLFINKFPLAKWDQIIDTIQDLSNNQRIYGTLLSLSFIIEINRLLKGKYVQKYIENYK